ncbi:unnamed protein product [Mortierella alpina]
MGKKHKRKAIEDEDLNAGVFKKALVTPAQAVGSAAYNGSSLNELDLLGGMDSGSDADSSEDEAPKNKGNRPAASGAVRGLSNIEATKVEADTASAVMANMASLFANAGHSQDGHTGAHQHQQSHPMGEDVMQMQQQLQMLLQESMSSASTGHQEHEQSIPIQDTTALLMNISNDPSILATVSNAQSTSSLAGETTTRKEKNPKKKKSKSSDQEHHRNHESAASSSSSKVSSAPKRSLEEQMDFDMAGSSDNPLHTKWMMATALKEKGIAYRTGTFSSQEDQLIRQTIRDYVARHNMPEDAIKRWFENGNGRGRFEKNDLKALWVEIAVRLQTRPLLNIYLHVRRMFHPQNNIGQWTKEDDEKLVALYQKHKGQWTVIGQELGRMADSCRDRYRNHLKDQDTMKSGTWAPEEDEKLLSIMQELAAQQGKSSILESTHMWTLISEKMGGTRSRHQCRHRFSQTLQPRLERGEWTGPSSAAARAAASVAESVKETTAIAKHTRPQPGLTHSHSSQSASFTAADELRVLTEALQGAIPSTSENLLWTQAMTTSTGNNNSSSNEYDELAAAIAAAASLPNPGNIPKAPKGPIRRKGGLQQQLDVLKMIQEFGYKDHTEIKWGELAKQLRSRVEESNTAQLAKIMQQHEHLESQLELQQHQGGYSSAAASATATAAATHAMAAAVAAAQQENVQSLQKLPAANQLTRTFMSTRCKTEGYREMTLQEVVKVMILDVEQRIKRRNARYAAAAADVEANGAETSTSTTSVATATGMVQQQNMNDAAQHAALAMLSAQFPACNGKKGAVAVGSPSASKDSETAIASGEAAFPHSERRRTASQQQQDHDVAERMLTTALINSELIPTRRRPSKAIAEAAAGSTVKSTEYLTDTSDESDGDE